MTVEPDSAVTVRATVLSLVIDGTTVIAGWLGATLSSVRITALAVAVLPAASAATAVKLFVPWKLRVTIVAHLPSLPTTVVPMTFEPSTTLIVAPTSPVPLIVCVALLTVAVVLLIATLGATLSIVLNVALAMP